MTLEYLLLSLNLWQTWNLNTFTPRRCQMGVDIFLCNTAWDPFALQRSNLMNNGRFNCRINEWEDSYLCLSTKFLVPLSNKCYRWYTVYINHNLYIYILADLPRWKNSVVFHVLRKTGVWKHLVTFRMRQKWNVTVSVKKTTLFLKVYNRIVVIIKSRDNGHIIFNNCGSLKHVWGGGSWS